MTLEELAEEYANKHTHYEVGKRENGVEYAKQVSNVTIQQAFLAGLKAGRPQWHDLRVNPNDLPEKMGLGSKEVYIAYKDDVTDFASYRFDKKCWERSENEELAENVIAWCEIPTFDKE